LSRDEGARPHGLNLEFTVAVAIFGAATFAALVLVIQDPTNFKVAQTGLLLSQTGEQEFHDLVIYLGAVCVMSAFSVLSPRSSERDWCVSTACWAGSGTRWAG